MLDNVKQNLIDKIKSESNLETILSEIRVLASNEKSAEMIHIIREGIIKAKELNDRRILINFLGLEIAYFMIIKISLKFSIYSKIC